MSKRLLEPFETASTSIDDLVEAYDRLPCGYLFTTESGVIRWSNRTFLRMAGLAEADTMPRLQDLLSVGGRIFFETHLRPLLKMQGWVKEVAVDIVNGTASEGLPVLLNGEVRHKSEQDGSPTEIVWTVMDISERRGYERELLAGRNRAERAENAALTLADQLRSTNEALNKTVSEQRNSSLYIRKLEGILPMCMRCKSVRSDDDAQWVDLDRYLVASGALAISHSLCPPCEREF